MKLSMGNNIRNARKKVGMTQEELACQIGVTAQAVSRWESGAGLPDISMVVPLAQTLSISTDALFGFSQNSYNELYYLEVKEKLREICEGSLRPESALEACRYVQGELKKDPANYAILCLFTERVANLSRYVDYDHFAVAEWPGFRDEAVRAGVWIIRYSENREWVERAHFALAWIYIHEKKYDSAREHIRLLPSIASNRLQESILAELAVIENGIEAHREVFRKNLQNFTRAVNKEIRYAMETLRWSGTPEETIALGTWGLKVIGVLSENPDMITYCRGFTRDDCKYMVSAYLLQGRFEEAAGQFNFMRKEMQRHIAYYQQVLSSEEEQRKFDENTLRHMRSYTAEFVERTEQEILDQLRHWHGDEVYDRFIAALG